MKKSEMGNKTCQRADAVARRASRLAYSRLSSTALLWLTWVLSVGIAARGLAVEPNTALAEIVAEIQRLGCKVTFDNDRPGRPVSGVDASLTRITDAELERLKVLTQLRELNLRHANNITDAGLAHLTALKHLQVLNLWFTDVTDAGLKHLKGLTELRTLNLRVTDVTDAGWNTFRD